MQASRITSGLKETSAEWTKANLSRSCFDNGCHSNGDGTMVANVPKDEQSKNKISIIKKI